MRRILLTSVVALKILVLVGCVYPHHRNYYEPSSSIGVLGPTGCVSPKTIYRERDNLRIIISDNHNKNQKEEISITLGVESAAEKIAIDPDQIKIELPSEQGFIFPSQVSFSSYDYLFNERIKLPFRNIVTLYYPVKKNDAERFKLLIGSNSITLSGSPVPGELTAPIEFKKIKKTGFFVVFMNC